MSQPPRYVPFNTARPKNETEWRNFRTRLTDYVAQVAQGFQSNVQRQIEVQGTFPGTTGTVPFRIEAFTDGTPNASLIADGMTLHFVNNPSPGAGQWYMVVSDTLNQTTITFGTAVTTRAWFSFLTAR